MLPINACESAGRRPNFWCLYDDRNAQVVSPSEADAALKGAYLLVYGLGLVSAQPPVSPEHPQSNGGQACVAVSGEQSDSGQSDGELFE